MLKCQQLQENMMDEIPESGKRRMPTGRELMARLRPRLDRFWNSPALSQQVNNEEAHRGTHVPITLREVARDHLDTLPSGLEAQPEGSNLHFIGKWTTRNGRITDIEGQGNVLPSDDRLLVVTISTTVTSMDYAENDTHVALFEIVSKT
jgi:hypothetical protein